RIGISGCVDQQSCFVENANIDWPWCGSAWFVMFCEQLADGVPGAAYDKLQVGAPEKAPLDDLQGKPMQPTAGAPDNSLASICLWTWSLNPLGLNLWSWFI